MALADYNTTILQASNILTWDIETFPAKWELEQYDPKLYRKRLPLANLVRPGGMLSWSAKWLHEPNRVYYSDVHDPHMHERLADLLDRASFDVTYNGGDAKGTSGGFDHKKVRGYLATRGMLRPRPSKSIDVFKTIKTFGFEYNSLAYACKMFNTPHQKLVEIGAGNWQGVLDGDPATIKLHRRYGTHDVRCTEDLYLAVLPWIVNHPHMGFAAEDDAIRCTRCGSDDYTDVGAVQAVVIRYRQYRCGNCKGLFRGMIHSRAGNTRVV